jgi:hypothetical protein
MNPHVKKPRVKRWKAPQPVPPPKPPRPKRSSLKHVYKDLISTNRDQRLEALKKAMHWYEALEAYLAYESALTVHQLKAKSEAEKHRLKGLNSDKFESKEKEYIAAIQQYEKMGRKYGAPKIGVFLSKYSHVRSKLEKRRNRYYHKFQEFLELLNNVLRPRNSAGDRLDLPRVDKISAHYRVNSQGNLTFDRKFLEFAKRVSRTHGLLPGLLTVFPAFTEAAATTMEVDVMGHRTGRYELNNARRYNALLEMLQNLVKYCLTDNAKRLIRKPKLHRSAE